MEVKKEVNKEIKNEVNNDVKKESDKGKKKQFRIIFLSLLLFAALLLIYFLTLEEKDTNLPIPLSSLISNTEGQTGKTTGNNEIPPVLPDPLKEIPRDIVLLIVENPDYSVPSEFNFSKREVVLDYIDSCKGVASTEGKVNCLDVYFLNNVPVLKPLLENCTAGDKSCLDTYYFEAAMYGGQAYCAMVTNESLKEECSAGE
jgi:hypothetical protein